MCGKNTIYKNISLQKLSLNLQSFIEWQKYWTTEMATMSILHREAYPRKDTDDYGEFHKYFHTQEKNK